eukprot:927415-Rhodomonas_salina.1
MLPLSSVSSSLLLPSHARLSVLCGGRDRAEAAAHRVDRHVAQEGHVPPASTSSSCAHLTGGWVGQYRAMYPGWEYKLWTDKEVQLPRASVTCLCGEVCASMDADALSR